MDFIWNFELSITLFFQSLGGWLVTPMQLLSFLGTEHFFLVAVPAIYWCVDVGLGLHLGLMLLLSTTLNDGLKLAFHGTRPYWFSPTVKALGFETSFGMPSGHAQTAAALWGLLAASLRRGLAWVLALAAIVGIGISRIYLGLHFTSDVLAGWVIGGLLVVVFIRLAPPFTRWVNAGGSARLTLAAAGGALGIVIYTGLFRLALGSYTLPSAWAQNALLAGQPGGISPLDISGAFTNAGIWLGMVLGVAWLRSAGGYDPAGPAGQRAARFALGLAGVLLLYLGLGSLFPDNPSAFSYALRTLRYTLIGLWVSGAAPLLFIRLDWARPASEKDHPVISLMDAPEV